MDNLLYLFLQRDEIPALKLGHLGFIDWDLLRDPFLINRRPDSQSIQNQPMADSEFERALKTRYDGMSASMKGLVSWEYYYQQALKNRPNIESQLGDLRHEDTINYPSKEDYDAVCVLRLFSHIQSDLLWHLHGEKQQSIALALDRTHSFFVSQKIQDKPQMFSEVHYDDKRPGSPSSSDRFPAFFQRPQLWEFEQEWRLVRLKSLAEASSGKYYFKLPKGLIKGIYIGCHAPKNLISNLRQLVGMDLQFRHIPMWHMGVDERYLRLREIPILTTSSVE